MSSLTKVRAEVDALPTEERLSLLTHLLHSLPDAPQGPSNDEVLQREAVMEAGEVTPISHEDFVAKARPT